MQLMIDGTAVQAQAGESLREIIIQNHMDTDELQTRPLAAKIAGEVFTLNYIPVRASDSTPESASVRRAMAASKGKIHLLRYSDGSGKKVYTRTACFLVFLAIRKRWPGGTAKISCTMGNSVYISVKNCQGFSVETLKDQMQQDIREDFPLIRRRVPLQEAIRQYENNNQRDKAELLQWYDSETFDEYYYKDFSDYFFGEMIPSSGYLTVWNIIPAEGGFILLYPDDLEPNRPTVFKDSPNFFSVFSEGEHWGTLME